MKKVKIAFWAILLGFFALVIMQNQEFFMAKQSFRIDLFIREYITPALPNAILIMAFFLVGLLIAYFFSLSGRFKSNRTIKTLNATVDAQRAELDGLKQQVAGLSPPPSPPEPSQGVVEPEPEPEP
jgi:uncharacterized integral membrane protein